MSTEGPETHVRRILIGYDGSDGAHDAVALATVFCGDSTEEALLVNVLPYPGPLPVSYRLLGYDEAPAWKVFFKAPEASLRGIETRNRTYTGGSPAKVMSDVAEGEDFDLIVVGSPHRGAVGRGLIGSVAQGLLHGATVPTVVAPRGYADQHPGSFRKIAVGYDGSSEAAAAIARAEALIADTDGKIEILTVATPPMASVPLAGPLPSSMPEPEKVLAQGIGLVAPGIEVHGRALHGDAAHELAAACEDVDLLIVGSRGYGPFARVMLGSVSTELIHLAPCPVLVMTRPRKVVEDEDSRGTLDDATLIGSSQ